MDQERRSEGRRSAAACLRDGAALVHLGLVYWLRIHPQVRRELDAWEACAKAIPDVLLRKHALAKLDGERLNPEAAALFAVLAPRRARRRVVTLIVAYQVLYDYLDGVNEEPGFDSLEDGFLLHRALTDAVFPNKSISDYYRHHPERDDGGYMLTLVEACREIVAQLPSLAASAAVIRAATERCGHAQSHNHAIHAHDDSGLRVWSLAQGARSEGYLWWEVAAGGISCLAIHALLAAGADGDVGAEEAARVDGAYFPSVCALSALLDSLADYHGDAGTDNHSFIAHYRDWGQVAERLVTVTEEASGLIRPLRHSSRHAIILMGIVAYYLSCSSAWDGFPATAAERLLGCMGSFARLMRSVMRARRRLREAPPGSRIAPGRAVINVSRVPGGQGSPGRAMP